MNTLKYEVRKLDVSLNGMESIITEVPTQEEENQLLEFVIFVQTYFFKDGKFKINWWGLVINPKVAGILTRALPPLIKAVRKWLKI